MKTKETELERIKRLTNDKDHIREQALRLAGIHLQGAKEDIIEREDGDIGEEDSEIHEACCDQLEVIGSEIERIGVELEQQSKDNPCPLGVTYLLSDTQTSTHRVTIDEDHVTLQQKTTFHIGLDDQIMLVAILKGIKADKNVPHSFSNVNATYNFFYEPGGAGNSFVIRHMPSGRIIGMEPRTAYNLLSALTGKTEHLVRIGGDTLVPATRVHNDMKETHTLLQDLRAFINHELSIMDTPAGSEHAREMLLNRIAKALG